jgi:hypothetical protein
MNEIEAAGAAGGRTKLPDFPNDQIFLERNQNERVPVLGAAFSLLGEEIWGMIDIASCRRRYKFGHLENLVIWFWPRKPRYLPG